MLQLKVTQILQYLPNYLSNQFLLSNRLEALQAFLNLFFSIHAFIDFLRFKL